MSTTTTTTTTTTEGIAYDQRALELLRHAADVVFEIGVDGRIVYVSEAVKPILARPPSAFIGRSFLTIIVAEDRAEALAQFQKVVSTGAEPIIRFRVPRKDGLRLEFEATVRSFKSTNGDQRIVGVARDITQQSAESAVARERHNHYRDIVESGPRPAAVVAANGDVIFANQRFKATFDGLNRLEDIIQRTSEAARHAMETAWFESNRLDRDGAGGADFEYTRDSGETSWFGATWESFQATDGQRHFAMVYEDISKRKKIENALRSIARGLAIDGRDALERNVEMVAQALEFDRLVLGGIKPDEPGILNVTVAWQDGVFLDLERLELANFPDAAVARGEAVIYPAGLDRLIPSVAEHFAGALEAYAGIPLRRADGMVVGLIGGYGRKPIADPELTRSVLSAFAAHAAAAVDRQQANEEIRANQDRFDVLARQTDEMLIEVDEAQRITFASQASFSLLGYHPSELIGRDVRSLSHPEEHAYNVVIGAQQGSDDDQTFAASRVRHADGDWRWVESRTSVFTGSDGTRRGLVISRDVTDRRRKELGRDLLYRVVQQGTDLVFVCAPDSTRLIFANEAATRRLGAFSDDSGSGSGSGDLQPRLESNAESPSSARLGDSGIEDRVFYELLPPEESLRLRTQVIPELTPTRPWSGELQLLGIPDAAPIPTEATIFLFPGADDASLTYLGITLRNIEARRTAEEALRQSELRLNQAQKMEAVGRLAGGIAHDFNNLLTAIIGYSDLVLDELGDGHVAKRDAEEILRAAERAGGLTRQLLAFSRRQVLQAESVDLNAVVADIDRMMRRLIGENIELVTVQDGELRPLIADPGQIEQVIVNLVVNARDAMPQGGRIEIETANHHAEIERRTDSGILPAGDYIVLCVSDSGQGMDAETRAQIFEPFFTTKQTHEGTGLGLASVYGIVNQSGGQIDVETSPGAGTRFTIYFPVAEVLATTPDEARSVRARGGNETILLVEDAAPVRRLVQRTLEKAGYTVLSAESATAALRHCSRHQGPVDLLLTDVVLPKVAGPEIARRALELRPGIRVLFMSGFSDDTLSRHGLNPARVKLIEKPFTPASILHRVRAVLDEDLETSAPA